VDGALRHQPPHLLGHLLRWAVHLLVESHLLLAAEALAAGVAEVEAGHVAPLVDHEVVGFGEGALAPAAVKSLPDWAYLERFLSIDYFCLVHVNTEADREHPGSSFSTWTG